MTGNEEGTEPISPTEKLLTRVIGAAAGKLGWMFISAAIFCIASLGVGYVAIVQISYKPLEDRIATVEETQRTTTSDLLAQTTKLIEITTRNETRLSTLMEQSKADREQSGKVAANFLVKLEALEEGNALIEARLANLEVGVAKQQNFMVFEPAPLPYPDLKKGIKVDFWSVNRRYNVSTGQESLSVEPRVIPVVTESGARTLSNSLNADGIFDWWARRANGNDTLLYARRRPENIRLLTDDNDVYCRYFVSSLVVESADDGGSTLKPECIGARADGGSDDAVDWGVMSGPAAYYRPFPYSDELSSLAREVLNGDEVAREELVSTLAVLLTGSKDADVELIVHETGSNLTDNELIWLTGAVHQSALKNLAIQQYLENYGQGPFRLPSEWEKEIATNIPLIPDTNTAAILNAAQR